MKKVRKQIFHAIIFLLLAPVYSQGNDSFKQTSLEIPLCPATVSHKNGMDHEVHQYAGFTLCYRESHEVAEWVAYRLTKEKLAGEETRSNNFRADPKITTESASPDDYKRSGYDRGHLAPAADMKWSQESMSESFLMSNMTPQLPSLNRGCWKKLEDKIRDYADKFGEVIVVTGPVLDKSAGEYKTIGKNNVSVPELFYKVILVNINGHYRSRGFIMPNTDSCNEIPFEDSAVTVNRVEELTGLDFFSALPDTYEESVEDNMKELDF